MTANAKLAALLALKLAFWSASPALAEEPSAPAPAEEPSTFSEEQLEQIAAPIALYPDALVSQIFMASTYPLEIVQAARWSKSNPELSGEALDNALKEQDWDPSVKSLCTLPKVLQQLSDNLDWTQDMGDAFLGQRSQLMDAVQRMRGKAYAAGNLETTEQQTVTQQPDKIIVIESKDPEVVYVPSYSPTVVYTGWSYPYPYYPPMYAPVPYGYGFMTFAAGVAVGAAVWGGCNWGWGNSDVDIDVSRQNNFNRNTNIDGGRGQGQAKPGDRGKFQHDAGHRKGVGYRDQKTAQQFGAKGDSSRVTRDQARGKDVGRTGPSAGTRDAGGRTGPSAGTRDAGGRTGPSAGTRDAGGRDSAATRDAGSRQPAAGSRDMGSSRDLGSARDSGSRSSRQASSRGSAWSGSSNPSFDRASSSRGSASRGGMSRGGGGGSRGGGGGGRRR